LPGGAQLNVVTRVHNASSLDATPDNHGAATEMVKLEQLVSARTFDQQQEFRRAHANVVDAVHVCVRYGGHRRDDGSWNDTDDTVAATAVHELLVDKGKAEKETKNKKKKDKKKGKASKASVSAANDATTLASSSGDGDIDSEVAAAAATLERRKRQRVDFSQVYRVGELDDGASAFPGDIAAANADDRRMHELRQLVTDSFLVGCATYNFYSVFAFCTKLTFILCNVTATNTNTKGRRAGAERCRSRFAF
jgi:hypothetical protein